VELSVLKFEIKDDVAVITMNNPPVNALTPVFLEDFNQIVRSVTDDKKVRAAMMTSACPGFFSAGDDITALKDIDDALIALLPKAHALLADLEALPVPTVAAINGHALGGGLELALVCDFRFMARDSGRIGLPEVRLGMIPSLGGTQRLPLLIGKAKAVEMMFKGLQILPEEAKAIGLVNEIFSPDDLHEKSFDYARRLARQATGAIAKIKSCVNTGLYHGLERGLAREREAFKKNIISSDVKEGIDAFLSGRKPEFKG